MTTPPSRLVLLVLTTLVDNLNEKLKQHNIDDSVMEAIRDLTIALGLDPTEHPIGYKKEIK